MSADLTSVLLWVFWISSGLILYTYFCYPLLLIAAAGLSQMWGDLQFASRRKERRRLAGADGTTVSLCFAAHNEEAVIEAKLRNCAALVYPPGQLEILIGCDACSDRTADLSRRSGLAALRVFDYQERTGKPEVLNRLVREAQGELVVFCDANTMLAPNVLEKLVRHFQDSRVGCVCGELQLVSPDGRPQPEGLYWRYELFLKFLESRLNLLLGANGAVYAIRRALFTTLPKQAIVDDFLVAMQIRNRGFRVIYDPEAVASEETPQAVRAEFRRRVRIGAGNFHALRYTLRLLTPLAGPICFSYWSHKVFRWLVPFALPVAFVAAAALSLQSGWFYGLCAAGGLLLTALAAVGYRLEVRNIHYPPFSVPYYFLSMNLALFLGFLRFVSGSQTAVWQRTARERQHS